MFFKKKKEEETIMDRPAPENEREAQIRRLRYGKDNKKQKADLFIRAFMMMNISYNNNLNGYNKAADKKEIEENLRQLGILDCERDEYLVREWETFARDYLESCLTSSQYRSALSGMIKYSDEQVANMIVKDIDTVLRKAPGQYGLDDKCEDLREIFRKSYIEKVGDGERIWEDYYKNN